jgi:hypothetical protein
VGCPVIMTDTGIARDLELAGADIDVVPAAYEAQSLTPTKIEELSRVGNTRNVASLVAAMNNRAKRGREREMRDPIARFPFERRRMLASYDALYMKNTIIL